MLTVLLGLAVVAAVGGAAAAYTATSARVSRWLDRRIQVRAARRALRALRCLDDLPSAGGPEGDG